MLFSSHHFLFIIRELKIIINNNNKNSNPVKKKANFLSFFPFFLHLTSPTKHAKLAP